VHCRRSAFSFGLLLRGFQATLLFICLDLGLDSLLGRDIVLLLFALLFGFLDLLLLLKILLYILSLFGGFSPDFLCHG
jgi:hypothetical protein